MESNSVYNHASDSQNRTTAQRQPNLLHHDYDYILNWTTQIPYHYNFQEQTTVANKQLKVPVDVSKNVETTVLFTKCEGKKNPIKCNCPANHLGMTRTNHTC